MKKSILITLITLLCYSAVFSQSPIIKDFRAIVKEIPTNFVSLKKDFVNENTVMGLKIYTTNLDLSPICGGIIIDKKGDNSTLVLNYELAGMDAMMLKIFNTMVPQYVGEINDMVKSGKYTASDTTEEGTSITTVNDLKGNMVLQYESDNYAHRITFFGNAVK